MTIHKILALSVIFVWILLTHNALAGSYIDKAYITNIKEVYKNTRITKPYQYCYMREVRKNTRGDGSATNELVGGIIGGAIGNQFGKGSGKDVATVAGALLGASIANDGELANAREESITQREVCETRHRYGNEERFSHYQVDYNYQGRSFSYESSFRPKRERIKVRVRVSVTN